MTLDLAEVARILAGRELPQRNGPRGSIRGWSVDSRTLEPGSLFFALRGPHHDGHDFLADVFRRGAAAAVVERAVPGEHFLIPVPDAYRALKDLAAWARSRWSGTVVGVTGSAGKTTTKDVLSALLATTMPAGKTEGNYNNHVGLPLSILRLPDQARVAVLELGMNHAGEIRELARIARPAVAVVTNVGYAHIENFDSIEGIALAKRELVESLPPDGVAVLNADDLRVARFREAHPGRCVTFGLSPEADVRAEDVEYLAAGSRFRCGRVWFETSLAGRHGVRNVLAGLAVARLFGIPPESLRDVVRTLTVGDMRGQVLTRGGVTIINDCYNSNPDAARAMLEVLRDMPARRRIAVLGEMRELGRWSQPLHEAVGRYAVECGVPIVVGFRGDARCLVEAAVHAGLPREAARFFEEADEAGDFLRRTAAEGDAILFKGSRGTRVERVLERFLG